MATANNNFDDKE